MAQNPERKKTSMIKTTLMQEKKAAKRDPEGAANVKKKAAAIGNIIMGLSLGAPIPLALRSISSGVMKLLTKRQLAKLKKIKTKEGNKVVKERKELVAKLKKLEEGEKLAKEARKKIIKNRIEEIRKKRMMDEVGDPGEMFTEAEALQRAADIKRYSAKRKKKSLMGGSN